jgi:hypothetical protein
MMLQHFPLKTLLTLHPGTTYTSYVTGTQTTTLLSSYPITQTETQVQTFTSSYVITTTAPGKFRQPARAPNISIDRSMLLLGAHEAYSLLRNNFTQDLFPNMHTLTFPRHHHIEHRHRDNYNSRKHGLYYKYTFWHNYHAHFLPSTCDHNLHFNDFPGPTDDNFGRWNDHYNYGRSYSYTGRSYTDTNPGLDGAWKHSPGFDNPYYDYSRS